MQPQVSKIILAVLITAVVVGSSVYYWQNQNSTQINNYSSVAKNSEQASSTSVVQGAISTDLFDLAKNSKNEFTYLVSAPKLDGDVKMLLKNNYRGYDISFSFTYSLNPWGSLRYVKHDLSASDGASFEDLPAINSYSFCAAGYSCDEQEHKGMGFDMTFWNAKFNGRSEDPKFYLGNGETFLRETDKYIVTYKPFIFKPFYGDNRDQDNVNKEVEKIVNSIEVY